MKRLEIKLTACFFLVMMLFPIPHVFAATLHVVLIIDTNAIGIGSSVAIDCANMQRYFVKRLPNARITLLEEKRVTKRRILSTLRSLPVSSGDSVLCYYSGHGAYDPTQQWNKDSHYIALSNGDKIFRR